MRSRLLRPIGPVLVILLLLISGCSKPAGPATESAPAAQGNAQAGASIKVPTDTPITLTVMSMYEWVDREALDAVIEHFETKHKNVKVKVKSHQASIMDKDRKVKTEIFDGVDVFWSSGSMVNILRPSGLVRDLSQMRWPEIDPLLADYVAMASQHEGQRFFVPMQLQPIQMTLFEKAFTAANVPLPTPDWTFADFEEKARQLKAADKEIAVTVFDLLEPTVRAFGGGLYDTVAGRWTFDTPENRQALTYLGRLAQDGLIEVEPQPRSFSMDDGPAMSTGTGDMQMPGYSFVAMPSGPAGRRVRLADTGAMVMANSQSPEAALAFVQELLSETGQTAFARSGFRPVVGHPAAVEAWRTKLGADEADRMEGAMEGAFHEGSRPTVSPSHYTDLQQFFEGKTTLDQLLPDLDKRFNQ